MPKKFEGENSKVAVARARKEATKAAEKSKKEAAEEEERWKDDDKNVQKKLQRKDEKEKKRTEVLLKKAELKELADKELDSVKVEAKQPSSKVSRLQIQVSVVHLDKCGLLSNSQTYYSIYSDRLRWKRERQQLKEKLLPQLK